MMTRVYHTELVWIVNTIGYHPDPSNSFLVTSTRNIELVTTFFVEEGFKIETGLRSLCGYIRTDREAQDYMNDKVDNWVNPIEVFSHIAVKDTQATFDETSLSLQNEWEYTQLAIDHPVEKFAPLDHSLAHSF